MGNIEPVEKNGTTFAPKQCLYQKVAVGMENPKMQSPPRCNKRTGRYGSEKNPDFMHRLEGREWKSGKLRTCRIQWYRVCIQAMFISKGSSGYGERQKCNRILGAISAMGVTTRQITRYDASSLGPRLEIWENWKLSKTMVSLLHQSNVYLKR